MFHTPSALLDITLKNVFWAPISLYSVNYILAHCMHVVNGNHRKWKQIYKQNKVMSDTDSSSRGSDDSDESIRVEEGEESSEEESSEEEVEEEEVEDDDDDEDEDTEEENDESEKEYLTDSTVSDVDEMEEEEDDSEGLSISSFDSDVGMKYTINTNN